MRVMQLAGFRNLSFSTERRVAPSKMRERRGIGVTIENLRDTCLGRHGFLLITPVTSGEGIFETIGYCLGLDGHIDVEFLVRLDALGNGC